VLLITLPSNSRFHNVVLALLPAHIHSYNSSDPSIGTNPVGHPDEAGPDDATPGDAVPGDATPDGATPGDVSSDVTTQKTLAPLNARVRVTSHHDNSRGPVNLSEDAQAVSGTIDVTDAGLHGPLFLPPRGSDN
jgi:hypothetical protein